MPLPPNRTFEAVEFAKGVFGCLGDCRKVLKTLPSNSVEAVVTAPPLSESDSSMVLNEAWCWAHSWEAEPLLCLA